MILCSHFLTLFRDFFRFSHPSFWQSANGRSEGRRTIYGRHNLPLQRFNVKTRCTQWQRLCETDVSFFFLRIMQHPDASVRGTVIHRSLESEVKTLRGIVELQPTNKRLVHTDWYKLALITRANLYQWIYQFLNSHLKWKFRTLDFRLTRCSRSQDWACTRRFSVLETRCFRRICRFAYIHRFFSFLFFTNINLKETRSEQRFVVSDFIHFCWCYTSVL